jgi:hypothetical protein
LGRTSKKAVSDETNGFRLFDIRYHSFGIFGNPIPI